MDTCTHPMRGIAIITLYHKIKDETTKKLFYISVGPVQYVQHP
jgi:hypothetical protein